MPQRQRPTVRRQHLGSALRRLREAAGVDMRVAAEAIGGEKPKLSKIETGKQPITKAELVVLLDTYGVKDRRVRQRLDALRATHLRAGWWEQSGTILGSRLVERLAIERESVQALAYQALLVPGLLQTADYARAVSEGAEKQATPEQIDAYVDMRVTRQQQFFGREVPGQIVCVLDEAALHRVIGGPDVMAGQLRHLAEVSSPPQVSIQVIPYAQGWHPGLDCPFTIYSYPDPLDLDVVVLEYLDGALYLEEDGAVSRHRLAFDELRAGALSSRQSLEMISRLARDLTTR